MLLAPFLRRWTYTRHHEQVRVGAIALLAPLGAGCLRQAGVVVISMQCRSCWQSPVVMFTIPSLAGVGAQFASMSQAYILGRSTRAH